MPSPEQGNVSNHDLIENESAEPQSLEFGRAKSLLIRSFQFSQGHTHLQSNIYRWLHINYPAYRLNHELKSRLEVQLRRALPGIVRLPNTHFSSPEEVIRHPQNMFTQSGLIPIPPSEIETVLIRELRIFQEILSGSQPHIKDYIALMDELAYGIIKRDHQYIVAGGGRERRGKEGSTSPDDDKFLSHICYYCLLGMPTGTPEYDEMFRQLKEYIIANFEQEKLLHDVITVYNRHHPDQQVAF